MAYFKGIAVKMVIGPSLPWSACKISNVDSFLLQFPSSGRASGDRGEVARVLGDGQAVQRGERPHAAEDQRDGGQERGAQEEAGRRAKVQGAGIVCKP